MYVHRLSYLKTWYAAHVKERKLSRVLIESFFLKVCFLVEWKERTSMKYYIVCTLLMKCFQLWPHAFWFYSSVESSVLILGEMSAKMTFVTKVTLWRHLIFYAKPSILSSNKILPILPFAQKNQLLMKENFIINS